MDQTTTEKTTLMARRLLIAGGLLSSLMLFGQKSPDPFEQKAGLLINTVNRAPSDSDKVVALGQLAAHYYTYKLNSKADSVLEEQLNLAEHSENNNLLFSVLFSYSSNTIDSWNSVTTFDKALLFVEKGLAYARRIDRKDYLALALIRKAAILRNRGWHDAALEQTAQAYTALDKEKNDSIKCVLQLETGSIFLAKGNAVAAYENYNQAWDLAYANANRTLRTQAYHHIGMLYTQLGRADLAANVLKTSLEQNLRDKDGEGILYDYVDLARVTDQKEYIEKAIFYADSLGSDRNRMFGKQLMLAYYMAVAKNSDQALDYLYQNEDLHRVQRNRGPAQYQWQIGSIYFYAGQPDSAIVYFLRAAPELRQTLDFPGKIDLNKHIGDCLLQLGRTKEALPYFTEAVALAKTSNMLINHHALLLQLSQTQAATGDFKTAYKTRDLYTVLKDSANSISSGRELALLEVERANSKHQYDLAEMERKENQLKTLQYMFISLATVSIFIVLLLAGLFPGSLVRLVKPLGFIAFICLFEFIILLIDNELHHATHGAPLLIWIAKIGIIGLLLPLHHYLEHKVVHYIQSKKLAEMRKRLRTPGWLLAGRKKTTGVVEPTTPV